MIFYPSRRLDVSNIANNMTKPAVLERIVQRLPPGRARRRYENLLESRLSMSQGAVLCNEVPTSRPQTRDTAHLDIDRVKPYVDSRGELIIPCSVTERYRWWAGGPTVLQTLIELGANDEILTKYSDVRPKHKTSTKGEIE